MSDTAEQGEERAAERAGEASAEGTGETSAEGTGEASAQLRRARRTAAYRGARRVLSRPGFRATIRERLALLEDASRLYDLDESVDMYGDGIVAALEERVAGLLGMEAAAFFPTGTMAQQVALRCWAGRTGNPTVALHALSHPEVHERNALGTVGGLRPVRVTDEPRLPTADEVRDFEEPFGALMLELPLRDVGYVLPSWEELSEVVAAARERDAVVHFDGARLWECTPHFSRPLDEIAGLADSVYVSFYKSLGGFSGAALAGPKTLVDEAKTWRHRYGGMVVQQFPAVLSALAGLEEELPRLPEYVAHARVVAAALREGFAAAGVPWLRVHPEEPHTHEFQLWLPYDPEVVTEAATRQAEETGTFLFANAWTRGGPGLAVTEVSVRAHGLQWTAEDVKAAVQEFVTRLPGAAG
ncbi:threonine aldolase [Streptomyces avermitilis]|uniref:L-allo-threonine aldolase n=2 Tax=Streptomyces avermitilis TaxID=33903 RepID=Q82ED0_STRAW|nr:MULTISPECIES: beta-eliminating lyase-related protein [Streptomyces]KUN51684.1 threonine aldolase [Streptomyces avermitilis]MYT00273.1 threonine aldolase [Streptomyces sp. SID5469]OOV31544.1 threonine aldolase [Streptomyces avermitilis]BAC72397.1 putative L-allo-threonine aldolase [Streptomyces avermitilis MA-4680 = NBRC 14893]BBJ52736.1 threonine aldolase [Streptomyces avermitilis]